MIDYYKFTELGFNSAEAERRFSGGGMYENCLKMYFECDDIGTLAFYAQSNDIDSMIKTAHSLKGAASMTALTTLYRLYADMEDMLRTGNTDAALELVPKAVELENEFRRAAGAEPSKAAISL